ncbi:MAG: putative Ig domain-containing protein [Gemmatimonadaceae bacterium]|nr:putative Ig domain-containing protein [Gemmatimonadaceae bacterium]
MNLAHFIRRGGATLILGAAILVVVVNPLRWVRGDATAARQPDGRFQDLRYAPPASPLLRAILSPHVPVTERCERLFAIGGEECQPTTESELSTVPAPIARRGAAYEYAPSLTRPALEWSIEGQPEGLQIDAASGVVSGTPTQIGRYEMVVRAALSPDSLVQQRVALYVDDRSLWLGADRFGDDIAVLLADALRNALLPGLAMVLIAVAGGAIVGAYAGYYGGVLRACVRAAVSTLQSIPGVLLVFVAASASDLNRWVITAVVGCILLPDVAAGVQQRVEAFRSSDFVQAATELGLRDRTTLWWEIMWHNVRGYLIERTAVVFHAAILMDVTLSYVGLRDAQVVSLGGMLKSGRSSLTSGASSSEAAAALLGLLLLIVTISMVTRGLQKLASRPQ